MVYLGEDISNPESPRLHFWKQKFSIPELEDFILHEIVSAADKQEQPIGPKDKSKEKKDYWLELEPLKYADAEEANAVTFKEFVYNHIRMYLPSEYKQLVASWSAIEKWKNIDYLLDKIGNQYVEGVHYHGFKPFRNFAGGNIFQNQRGRFQTFKDFIRDMLVKYDDKNEVNEKITDPRDVVNVIENEELPTELLEDLEEPGVL